MRDTVYRVLVCAQSLYAFASVILTMNLPHRTRITRELARRSF